jgi:acetoin utilization deacetylase AcuC-like enzyme
MKRIYNKVFLQHDTGMHPEGRQRLECFEDVEDTEVDNGEQYLELVHTKQHIQRVREASRLSAPLDPDTKTSPGSWEAAVHAVGAAVMASKSGDFALVRPPGHHAHPDHAAGFCLFNNIAIAAQRLVKQGKRVLIFDFDGHWGDGTARFFYETDKVLYWSLHQSPGYPGSGTESEIGEGKGKGYTINMPMPPGTGDDIYLQAVNSLMKVAKEFKPDHVAVSAGFDSHHAEQLLQLNLTMDSYYELGLLLQANFKRIFSTLEGGYNTEYLPKCVRNFVDGINQSPIHFTEKQTITSDEITAEFDMRLSNLQDILKEYWKF